MNDRDWDILATIAEERNISRAAERLHLSQPALSYRLRAIEGEFETRAFVRSPKGVSLTAQGEQLVAYAREMTLALANARERLASFGGKVAGPLRIGSSAVFANHELPRHLDGFLRRYPEVDVHLRTGLSHAVLELLDREECTVAIVRGDPPWAEVKHLLREEPICLLSSRPLEIAQLADAPRIAYETDPSLQALLDEWWNDRFARPPQAPVVVDTLDACCRMVACGVGYAILPDIGLREAGPRRQPCQRPLHWSDGEPLLRRTWLLCREASLRLPPVQAFVEHLLGARLRREPPARSRHREGVSRRSRAGKGGRRAR